MGSRGGGVCKPNLTWGLWIQNIDTPGQPHVWERNGDGPLGQSAVALSRANCFHKGT